MTTFEYRIHRNINIRKNNIFFTKKQKKKTIVKSQLCFVPGLTLQRKTPA